MTRQANRRRANAPVCRGCGLNLGRVHRRVQRDEQGRISGVIEERR